MKNLSLLVLIALISHLAFSGIVNIQTNPQILTLKQSEETKIQKDRNVVQTISPIIFRFGSISIPKNLCTEGLHGLAYRQMMSLYPKYKNYSINSCSYTIYGPSRIYTFQLLDGNNTVKVLSSVQNGAETSGQSTQQTVQEETTAKIQAEQANKEEKIDKNNLGFRVIKLSRAYEIPRIALAIKNVIRENWKSIRSAPLVRCLQKWEKGVYRFRLFFYGVDKLFEYTHSSNYESLAEELQDSVSSNATQTQSSSNLRSQSVKSSETKSSSSSQEVVEVAQTKDQQFLSRTEPIFTIKSINGYNSYSVQDFKKHPGYVSIVEKCNQHFGYFDEKWVVRIQYKYDVDSRVHYFQFIINFIPFLVEVDLEAHYYGSTEKASILQIDQKVFSGKQNQKYFNNWNQIKNFNSYKAFRDANQYVLSQFTYLRFYKVTAAYSALYKHGRYVRLVYESEGNYFNFTPKGENQFNILVYIVDGKYYIDRNDFHATNTYSFGRNDWISLFVKVENVNTHEDYHRIVKYFQNQYLDFVNLHKIEEIRFKDNLYVVKFRNPTNLTKDESLEKYAVVEVTPSKIKVINHFRWNLVNDKSIEISKATNFIHQKYNNSILLFTHFTTTSYGKHYEVSFLNDKKVFSNAYLRFVDDQQLFTEDEWQGIAYEIDFDEVPLPKNPQQEIIKYIVSQDKGIVSVVQVKNVTKNTFICTAVTSGQRWRININWLKGVWVISNKQAILDGYYFVTGYPSINVASCTGYLSKIYPNFFNSKWIYSSIEVKNIGYFIYSRIIFKIGQSFYQGVVRTTHGIENSHTLISWDKVAFGVQKDDYGYGVSYSWNYGYNSKYFFDFNDQIVLTVKPQVIISQNKNKNTDLLCSYWVGDECLSCYGDYYADNGKCVKIQQECEFWSKSGDCERCSVGFGVDRQGKCVSSIIIVSQKKL